MPDTFTSGQEFRAQLARLIDAATKAKIHPTLIGNILEDAAESIRMSYATSAPIMWRRSRSINFADFPPNRDFPARCEYPRISGIKTNLVF